MGRRRVVDVVLLSQICFRCPAAVRYVEGPSPATADTCYCHRATDFKVSPSESIFEGAVLVCPSSSRRRSTPTQRLLRMAGNTAVDASGSFPGLASAPFADDCLCCVCLEGLEATTSPSHALTCGHKLHSSCIGNCIRSRIFSCPECRLPLTAEEIDHLRCHGNLPPRPAPAHPAPTRRRPPQRRSIFGAVDFQDSFWAAY